MAALVVTDEMVTAYLAAVEDCGRVRGSDYVADVLCRDIVARAMARFGVALEEDPPGYLKLSYEDAQAIRAASGR